MIVVLEESLEGRERRMTTETKLYQEMKFMALNRDVGDDCTDKPQFSFKGQALKWLG